MQKMLCHGSVLLFALAVSVGTGLVVGAVALPAEADGQEGLAAGGRVVELTLEGPRMRYRPGQFDRFLVNSLTEFNRRGELRREPIRTLVRAGIAASEG